MLRHVYHIVCHQTNSITDPENDLWVYDTVAKNWTHVGATGMYIAYESAWIKDNNLYLYGGVGIADFTLVNEIIYFVLDYTNYHFGGNVTMWDVTTMERTVLFAGDYIPNYNTSSALTAPGYRYTKLLHS